MRGWGDKRQCGRGLGCSANLICDRGELNVLYSGYVLGAGDELLHGGKGIEEAQRDVGTEDGGLYIVSKQLKLHGCSYHAVDSTVRQAASEGERALRGKAKVAFRAVERIAKLVECDCHQVALGGREAVRARW